MRWTGLMVRPVTGSEMAAAKLSTPICMFAIPLSFLVLICAVGILSSVPYSRRTIFSTMCVKRITFGLQRPSYLDIKIDALAACKDSTNWKSDDVMCIARHRAICRHVFYCGRPDLWRLISQSLRTKRIPLFRELSLALSTLRPRQSPRPPLNARPCRVFREA